MTITQFNLLSFKPVVPLFSIYYSFLNIRPPKLVTKRLSGPYIYIYIDLTQNKMNLFVLSGHGSESFAAFFNGVILQKNNAAVITTAVITTHHESKLRFK